MHYRRHCEPFFDQNARDRRIFYIQFQNFSGGDTLRSPQREAPISAWFACVPTVPVLRNDHWIEIRQAALSSRRIRNVKVTVVVGMTNAQEMWFRTMLAVVSRSAKRTETGGSVGVLGNAASAVLTLYPSTHIGAAVSYSTHESLFTSYRWHQSALL